MVNNDNTEWISNGSLLAQFHFLSSFSTGDPGIFNLFSPTASLNQQSLLFLQNWNKEVPVRQSETPKPACSHPEWYLFRLQTRRDPGILFQGTAWVIIWGRIPLKVKHEFADGLLHLQRHHCHHVLLLGTLAVQADLPAGSKGSRWERRKNHFFFFSRACQSPALGSQTINTFLGNGHQAKASRAVFQNMPVFAEGVVHAYENSMKGQTPPGKHAKGLYMWTPDFSSNSIPQEEW